MFYEIQNGDFIPTPGLKKIKVNKMMLDAQANLAEAERIGLTLWNLGRDLPPEAVIAIAITTTMEYDDQSSTYAHTAVTVKREDTGSANEVNLDFIEEQICGRVASDLYRLLNDDAIEFKLTRAGVELFPEEPDGPSIYRALFPASDADLRKAYIQANSALSLASRGEATPA